MTCTCKSAPEEPADGGCSGGESFALRVLGDTMAPEFRHGEIVIIEPDGALKPGCFVLAKSGDEWLLRQLCRRGDEWLLHALNPSRLDLPDLPLADLQAVHGVVVQKAVPGRRRLSKFYV